MTFTFLFLICKYESFIFYSLADVEMKMGLFDTKGIEAKRKELKCTVFNQKKHPILWLKNGECLSAEDNHIQCKQVDEDLHLISKELMLQDDAVYTCKVGNHTTQCRLEVLECKSLQTLQNLPSTAFNFR